MVSTHSRLKAAGPYLLFKHLQAWRFNTQPPEGGWRIHTGYILDTYRVSTHSRLKAAGQVQDRQEVQEIVFQHTAA